MSMKNVFIDSNIWLSLYHFTNDDLEQFGKLKELNGTDIKLFVPQQVYNEVKRNREAKLKDTFKQFEIKSIQFPAFCKEYEEYEKFFEDYTNILNRYRIWKTKIDTDIKNRSLPADKTINSFFEAAELFECDSLVEKAFIRYRLGNPPGKDNRYGDAVNWECLLASVPDGEDLYLISSDKDYRSELFDGAINPFLEDEWKSKKHSNIFFYKNLVPFLNEQFKNIQLKSEQEKQELILKLNNSPNFESTHGIIAMLYKQTGWTDSQIEDLCAAVENNNQVRWILRDTDVLHFYSNILSRVKYEELTDCATKRVMEIIFRDAIKQNEEARENYAIEAADTAEEYYKH